MSIADQLITNGWARGLYEDEGGRLCLMGAARYDAWGGLSMPHVTQDERERYQRRLTALYSVLKDANTRPDPVSAAEVIATFNDDDHTTYDDVLRAAKRADEILEEME